MGKKTSFRTNGCKQPKTHERPQQNVAQTHEKTTKESKHEL